MTKINKSALTAAYPKDYVVDATYDPSLLGYPIKEVKSLHYEARLSKHEDKPLVEIHVKGKLVVLDSRDNVPFVYPFNIHEETLVLDDEDGESEGYIISGSSFDLDALALEIVKSSLPIRLVRKEESTIKDECGGVRILSEEEKLEESQHQRIEIPDLE